MENRQDKIRAKGFSMYSRPIINYDNPEMMMKYNSIRAAGPKVIEDATLNLESLPKLNKKFRNKNFVLKAIEDKNVPLMREISDYYYRTNGIYSRVCNYFAYLYRYDWYIVPHMNYYESDEISSKKTIEKVLNDFDKILNYLDNSNIKKLCGKIALNVILYGAYYGYIIPSTSGLILQELPVNYCRSLYESNGIPVVEFDMRFFDDNFKDPNYRLKILKLFPKDVQKGYLKYKKGELSLEGEPYTSPKDRINNITGRCSTRKCSSWYTLEPGSAVRFCITKYEQPLFINAIPSLLDLEFLQDLDQKKQAQKLFKLLIQKLPLDKNGDLIFDIDEAKDIHDNAVEMLSSMIGIKVLTTFADVEIADLSDTNSTSTKTDDLQRAERTVFNNLGTSKNIFNSDSNLALEKSILDDEATMRDLLLQFSEFFDRIVQSLSRNKKKYGYKLNMLETSQYNYKEMAKMYKEQVQIGYSKMLPQIAMGHSQSAIINMAFFENNILHLSEIMIPPLMSSTMNSEALLGNKNQNDSSNSQNKSEGQNGAKVLQTEEKSAGRPEKADDQKSEKTIQNKESM